MPLQSSGHEIQVSPSATSQMLLPHCVLVPLMQSPGQLSQSSPGSQLPSLSQMMQTSPASLQVVQGQGSGPSAQLLSGQGRIGRLFGGQPS